MPWWGAREAMFTPSWYMAYLALRSSLCRIWSSGGFLTFMHVNIQLRSHFLRWLLRLYRLTSVFYFIKHLCIACNGFQNFCLTSLKFLNPSELHVWLFCEPNLMYSNWIAIEGCGKTWSNCEEDLRSQHTGQQWCQFCVDTADNSADLCCLRVHFLTLRCLKRKKLKLSFLSLVLLFFLQMNKFTRANFLQWKFECKNLLWLRSCYVTCEKFRAWELAMIEIMFSTHSKHNHKVHLQELWKMQVHRWEKCLSWYVSSSLFRFLTSTYTS